MHVFAAAGNAALDLLLPVRCSGCGDAGSPHTRGLCDECVVAIRQANPARWLLSNPAVSITVPAFAATGYDGVMRAVLLDFKEHARRSLRHELAGCLLVAVLAALTGPPGPGGAAVLVPVPSAARTRRARGHDPVGSLAAHVAATLGRWGMPAHVRHVLRQSRPVDDQSGLDITSRWANLHGALTVSDPASVRGRRVVIVDDIVTTGATALEAARALTVTGADVTAVACVAATPRRFPRSPSGCAGESSRARL